MITAVPMRILSFFYNDPDLYPPMINAAHVLDQSCIEQQLVVRAFPHALLPVGDRLYPSSTSIRRVSLLYGSSAVQYGHFVVASVRRGMARVNVAVGYDAHGLIPAWVFSRLHRIPLVYHCHDFMQYSEVKTVSQRIMKRLERYCVRRASLIIVPDKERGDVIRTELDLSTPPLVVANAPLERPAQSDRLRDTLSAMGRQFNRIVFRQGRIGPNHALEATVRSIPFWNRSDWGFVIMGPADSEYRDFLMTLARELGVADQFVVLPAVSYPDVAQFTVGADLGHGLYDPVHVNNQHITTASNKIMEYIAAGLPILLSDTPGSASLLNKYAVGVTADVTSPESIAYAINRIFENPAAMDVMREESRRAFEEEYNYRKQYAPVIERLREFAEGRR